MINANFWQVAICAAVLGVVASALVFRYFPGLLLCGLPAYYDEDTAELDIGGLIFDLTELQYTGERQ